MNNGFIVIDKPAGITSHDVVSRVRRILGTRKVGHTGTLDPFATGVLPVAVNDGTKAIPFLDEGVKCYQALMRLGIATDTLDITGKVLNEADWSGVDLDAVTGVLSRFTGSISQIPPMYSAIKRDGQPLYKLARQGQEIEREPRQVQIHSLDLISYDPPFVGFQVVCSRGTYVRSLADDMGRELGCGATLQELRRTASGPFVISASVTLEVLEELHRQGRAGDLFVSPFDALGHMVNIPLTERGLEKLKYGRSPEWSETYSEAPVATGIPCQARLSYDGELVAVAQIVPVAGECGRLILKRVFLTV